VVRQHLHESPAEIVRQIDSMVTAAGRGTRHDDTTVLVLKWSGDDESGNGGDGPG
jgi:hypothetical protein